MKRIVGILCFTIGFCSCQKEKVKWIEYECKADSQIEMFTDSSFFSNIRCMQYCDDYVYSLDVERREIIAFDEKFENTRFIGKPGPGPEELNVPGEFYVSEDTVYVLDYGAMGIKSFYKNQFIDVYHVSPGAADKRFFYTSDYFYMPSATDSSIFLVMNKDISKKIMDQRGGEPFKFETGKETIIHNSRSLLYDGNGSFYAISDNLANVQKYDLKTLKLVCDFDLSKIPLIKRNLNYISSQKREINSFYVYIEDSYIANNFLYLLCAELGPDYQVNQLIKIALLPPMELSAIYSLPGKIYGSFCVSPDYIFAFNWSGGTIDKIKLSNYE
jgi:hypothetical protein